MIASPWTGPAVVRGGQSLAVVGVRRGFGDALDEFAHGALS
jgi:hypothetical protein